MKKVKKPTKILNKPVRVYHPWWKWECYWAGMYDSQSLTLDEGQKMYCDFLSDENRFEHSLWGIVTGWPCSCEQFLMNENINRIAWLGQAAMAFSEGLSRKYRGGFKRLSVSQQRDANELADKWLKISWEVYAR